MSYEAGAVLHFDDGDIATVVYHGLDGYGIKYGDHSHRRKDILSGCPLFGEEPEGWDLRPEAMLHECGSTDLPVELRDIVRVVNPGEVPA